MAQPLSSSHRDKEEVGTPGESQGMNLPLVNCLLFSISMHSPCLSAPPSSFNYSPSFACFSFRLSRSTSSTSLHPTRPTTHTLSLFLSPSLFIRLEILVSPVPFSSWANLLLTFRRISMSRGGNTRMAAVGGESCPLTLGIGETEIKKGRNIPRSDFNFRRRRLKGSSTTNASRLFLEIRVNER